MKRTRFSRRGGLTRDAEQLIWLALGLSQSGSRVEDGHWEARLNEAVDRLLAQGNDDALNAALDELYRSDARAYGELADVVEARAESGAASADASEFDTLLVAAPVLSWSRYAIPASHIPKQALDALRVQLSAHVFAADTRLALADYLFSPDQLPSGYAQTRALAQELSAAALRGANLPVNSGELPETAQFLSDMRYILAVVAAPRGRPLFRWEETDGSREQAVKRWREQGAPGIQSLFSGCSIELVGPDAYYSACREADRQLRPYALRASVAFLQMSLEVPAGQLRAVVAPFSERRLEEFRVGFTRSGSTEVLHGAVWPLLDAEDESTDTAGQIETVLREAGLADIMSLEHPFPMEYCDDCGAPMYPDPEGHAVHAELPEQDDPRPAHLH